MSFPDAVSVVSGRNSRASNVSGMTGTSHPIRSGPLQDDTLNSAGVMSMLKTSTDTGDLGTLSFNTVRLPSMPRAAHPRRNHASKLSGSSHGYPGARPQHRYAPSQASKTSDGPGLHRRGSFTSMQSMPPALLPGYASKMPQAPMSTFDKPRESRSYSLTSAPASQQLPRLHSATSLKSAGHEPRHFSRIHLGHPPLMPENRPPYIYPTRLKRPGYRSPSPALSDLSSQGVSSLPVQGVRRPPASVIRPQPQTYNSDYGADYRNDPRHVNQRAYWHNPHHTADTSYSGHHGSRQGLGRAGPSMLPVPPMQPQHQTIHYGPPRPLRAGALHAQRTARPSYHQIVQPPHAHSAHHGAINPVVAPAAHSMFHNAARMVRSIPQRSNTPVTDISPPSSDPPSSGTVASSSNPATPKDSTTGHVTVNPLFIDPTLADSPDSSSEPVLPHRYFEFAEGLHKPVIAPDVDAHHPSVPASGFVQRVRAMLESKATVDQETDHGPCVAEQQQKKFSALTTTVEMHERHELPANETPRFTIIEEFEAPVELPASPVRLPELASDNSAAFLKQRITREMVKAEIGTSSTDNSTQHETGEEMFVSSDARRIGSQNLPSQSRHNASHQPVAISEPADVNRKETLDDNRQRRTSIVEPSNTTSALSPEPSVISGIDYALRFSAPMDTTIGPENETQSNDPFALNADTNTPQNQQSEEPLCAPEPTREVNERLPPAEKSESKISVSSLHSEEGVSRTSAISPAYDNAAPVDENLRGENQDFSDLDSSLLASSPPPAAPSTPRTPRQYSKSVDLPHVSVAAVDTPTTNRFSLPPDFSNIGETTVESATEMVTDVAIRFSLPNPIITVDKPYIVTIPSSSSSSTPDAAQRRFQTFGLDPRKIRRSSLTFTDKIAPLNIKKVDPRNESQSIKESAVIRTRSIGKGPLSLEDISGSGQVFPNHTLDMGVSASNYTIPIKFSGTQLPGLKEESAEDASLGDRKHCLERNENFQFPLPARIAAVKAMQERRLHESAEKAKARRAARQHNRPLAEIRDLPSLNFSTMDLVDKLNSALKGEMRPTKSMEVTRRHDIAEIFCPSPQRPRSTEPLIERYTSFFIKPEDFEVIEELCDNEQDESMTLDAVIPTLQVQESTEVQESEQWNHLSLHRPLSPEEFLNVATQVNRLSIPSVSGLSERLSELLPCLKSLHLGDLLSSDDDVAHTIDDIHQLGRGPGAGTTLSYRTSAGFRTLAERAEDIVVNGTHDSALPRSKVLSINKELPPLPESASAGQVTNVNLTDGKQSYLSGSVSAPSVFGNPPTRPESALIRHKSPTTEEEMRHMLPPESNPIARSAKRSLMLSGISTRPWNQDENYPWAGSNITIDLSIPTVKRIRTSITGEVVRAERRSKSLDFTSLHDISDGVKGIDIGSITTLNRSASLTTEQATGVAAHARKQSLRSIIGSISKKIGLGARSTATSNDVTVRHLASPIKASSVRESGLQSHRAGDRYPTSSLTPPSNLNLDEVRSFFSDDSSERHRNASLKKRLTNFKSKGKSVRLDGNPSNRSLDAAGETTYDAGSVAAERLGATSSAHTYNVGMGKAEFHMKRFGERIRLLLAKGGELFRSMSRRSRVPKVERVHEDWLSDSLYSGA